MKKPEIAILGVGSIGKFHAQKFHEANCNVTAILCSSESSALEKSEMLREEFDINAKPYHDLSMLLENEELDAVSICTPASSHGEYTEKCLQRGIHVLCEKPFILDPENRTAEKARKLVNLANSKSKVLTVNTQLVSMLETILENEDLGEIREFSMYMEAQLRGKANLILEAIPHANSFLIRLLGDKEIEDIKFLEISDDEISVNFQYGPCKANYHFKLKEERPRTYNFTINGTKFEKAGNYQKQQISYNGKSMNIEDPLRVSIQRFVSSISSSEKPLISEKEIIKNLEIQDKILERLFNND